MDHKELINRLSFIVFCGIVLLPGGHTQTVTSFTIAPNSLEEVGNFVFVQCLVEGFNVDQMVMSWRHNGRIFVDVVFGEDEDFRSNINSIFGFDVNPLYFSVAMYEKDEDDQIYEGQLDIFVDSWMVNGDYECVICRNNGNGRCEEPPLAQSGEKTLNVNYFPPDPYPQLETAAMQDGSFLAVVGSETMVSCYSLPGFPEIEFVLRKGTEVVNGEKIVNGDFIFYNYTFIPIASDDGVIFSCTIQEDISGNSNVKSLSAIQLASTPQVEIMGPSMAGINSTLMLTCEYTSATSTPVSNYLWNASSLKSSYSENHNTLTIQNLQATDNGAVVTCTVTDNNGMTGVGTYTVVAVDPEEIPTTSSSPTSSIPPGQSPVAIIVVVCIVVLLLLLLLIGTIFWWSRHQQKPKKSAMHFEKKPTTNSSVNKYDHHSDKNGPYTISNKVSNSPKPDIIPGYYSDSKYREHDYQMKKPMPVDDADYRYPSYERSRSHERFYPQEDDSPGYHFNPGYDDERQLYPQEFNDVEVGDFTQPSDRQPAYGQGYDDFSGDRGYDDPRGPRYDGYDEDYKPPLSYDDYGGSVEGYDDRYRPNEDGYRPDDGGYLPVDGGYLPDDGGYRPDDGGYRTDDGIPYRPPYDDDLNDGYYPGEEDQFPPQGDYGDPNIPAQDDYFQNEGNMYPKDDPYNQYDDEPYGERDQQPDGQEADFQGDPYNDPYYPSSVDRMPDGGSPSDDPYYGYDIHPDAGEFGTSESPKHNSDTLTSDQYDPSYV